MAVARATAATLGGMLSGAEPGARAAERALVRVVVRPEGRPPVSAGLSATAARELPRAGLRSWEAGLMGTVRALGLGVSSRVAEDMADPAIGVNRRRRLR